MKVFADAAIYGRERRFSSAPKDVYLSVGKPGAVPIATWCATPSPSGRLLRHHRHRQRQTVTSPRPTR